jgi:hypothetical protein
VKRFGIPRAATVPTIAGLLATALAGCRPGWGTPSAPLPSNPPDRVRATSAECPPNRAVIWRSRFEEPNWLATWDPRARFSFGEKNVEVTTDARFGAVLRVHYPAGSSSSSYAHQGHPVGGAEFKATLPGASDASSIFVSYWLKFDATFRWVRGGKLPGVCGGDCPSGGAFVSGEGGWSVRSMWRAGGAGELYAYMLPARAYGTEIGLGRWAFTTGGWHRIAEELILNAAGQADGVSRVWYDADPSAPPTFEARGLTFRRDATGATTLFFSTFFGGHDGSWATPVDTFVDFADFVACR